MMIALLAIAMLFSITACKDNSNNNGFTTNGTIDSETTYAGVWKAKALQFHSENTTEYRTSIIVLSADGSGEYEGKDITWYYDGDIRFTIVETNASGVLEVAQKDGKDVLLYKTSYSEASQYDRTYYREQDFVEDNTSEITQSSQAITIDLNNWNNYFEIVEVPIWQENAFGEIDSVSIEHRILLKPEYENRLDKTNGYNVAFAVKAQYTLVGFTFDTAKKEYTYNDDAIPNEVPENTDTTVSFKDGVTSIRLWSSGVGEREENGQITNDIYKYHDIEVTRVEGTIYLYD